MSVTTGVHLCMHDCAKYMHIMLSQHGEVYMYVCVCLCAHVCALVSMCRGSMRVSK